MTNSKTTELNSAESNGNSRATLEIADFRVPSPRETDRNTPKGEWCTASNLVRWVDNEKYKTVASEDVDDVERSLRRFGFVAPICVGHFPDGSSRMVAGHTRLTAAERVFAADPAFTFADSPGPGLVRVIHHSFSSERDASDYALADNRTQRTAWNEENVGAYLAAIDDENRRLAMGFRAADEDVVRMLQTTDDVNAAGTTDVEADQPTMWRILLTCKSEQDQATLLERLEADGYECKPLIG